MIGDLEFVQYDPNPPRFQRRTRDLFDRVNEVIREFWALGIRLTKRGIFYQFTQRGWIENAQKKYQNLCVNMTNGMRAGLIPWNAIVDLNRQTYGRRRYRNAGEYIRDAADDWGRTAGIDRWAGQVYRPFVYVEKNAVLGIVESVCQELDVDFTAGVGYSGDSHLRLLAFELMAVFDQGQKPVVILLTDHDPRGVHMEDDLLNRLAMFCNHYGYPTPEINRIALTMDQVLEFGLDTPQFRQNVKQKNSKTKGDTLAPAYIAKHGPYCWELDALPPEWMRDLLRDTILIYRDDEDAWDMAEEEEDAERDRLIAVADSLDE